MGYFERTGSQTQRTWGTTTSLGCSRPSGRCAGPEGPLPLSMVWTAPAPVCACLAIAIVRVSLFCNRACRGIAGLQQNYYWQTLDSIPVRIYQEPVTQMTFTHDTYSTPAAFDEALFELPSTLE